MRRVFSILTCWIWGVIYDRDGIFVPHPRLFERAFVLLPLRDVAPEYVHPVLAKGVDEMIAGLPAGQQIRKADESR